MRSDALCQANVQGIFTRLHYGVLEVSTDASQDKIKAQYLLQISAWHPDKFRNPEQKAKAEERSKDINEAYSILSRPDKRTQYDRERSLQSLETQSKDSRFGQISTEFRKCGRLSA